MSQDAGAEIADVIKNILTGSHCNISAMDPVSAHPSHEGIPALEQRKKQTKCCNIADGIL